MRTRFIRLNPEFGRSRIQAIQKLRYICNSYDFDSLMSYLRFLEGRLNYWYITGLLGLDDFPIETATN